MGRGGRPPRRRFHLHDRRETSLLGKFVFCLTGPYLTGRATIGRLELPPGEGRFVEPPLRATPPRITAYTARGSSD